jgi:serine/threonine-protein kinase
MAELFLAQRPPRQELLVIKRILPYLSEEPEFVQMFLDEARIAAQLHHPNVVQLHELGRQDNTIFIAMEYVEGIDLRRVMAEEQKHGSSVPYGVAARVCALVAAGLDHAHHSRGVDGQPLDLIHRDVSPQNVMVAYDGRVKLVDFGIAKAQSLADRSKPGVIKGKFLYLAPEQVGQERLDGRADIFALGVMMYELTTGRSPFSRPTTEAILYAIRSEMPQPPHLLRSDYPVELSRIVMKCLAKDRNQRYPRASAVQADLEAFLASGVLRQSSDVGEYVARLMGHEDERTVLHIPPAPAGRIEATQAMPSGLTSRPVQRKPTLEAPAAYEPEPPTQMTRHGAPVKPERSSPRAAPLPPPPMPSQEEGESTVQERGTRPRPPVPTPMQVPVARPSASFEAVPAGRARARPAPPPPPPRRIPTPVPEEELSQSISLTPATVSERPARLVPMGRRSEDSVADTISRTETTPRHEDPEDDESTAGYDYSPESHAPRRRRTGLVVALVAFAVMAVVGAALFWLLYSGSPPGMPVAQPLGPVPLPRQDSPSEAPPANPGAALAPADGTATAPGSDSAPTPEAPAAGAPEQKDAAPEDATKLSASPVADGAEPRAAEVAAARTPALVKVRFEAPRGTALNLGRRKLVPNTVLELAEGTHQVSFRCPGRRAPKGRETYIVEAGGASPVPLKVNCRIRTQR